MKKLMLSALAVIGLGLVLSAPAKAEIVTSTAPLVSSALKAAQTNGIIVNACIMNAGAASNTFYFYDGTTIKFQVTVATASTVTVDFKELLKEEWLVAGALNVKSSVEDALGRVTCSIKLKSVF